jgi:hypothetical protein
MITAQQEQKLPLFESGKVRLLTGDLEVLRVNVAGKKIDVDIEDKQFIKRAMKLRGVGQKKPVDVEKSKKKKRKSSPLSMVRMVADTSKRIGITLTVSYQGKKIATIGAEARPTLLQVITKTRALALNDPITALRMMI